MAREKGMGNLQREKSGRWTMRVGIDGKRYCRSTRTKDRDQAERVLQRFLAPFGLGEHRLPLADVWLEYVKSPNRNELAKATLDCKRNTWMQFARWMEHFYLPVKDLGGITADMIAEYLVCLRADLCATTYNNRVCVLREIFHVLAQKAGLEEDPWEGVRLRPDDSHSRRELTMDELRRLLDAAKKVKVKGEGEQRMVSPSFEPEAQDGKYHCTTTTSNSDSTNEWHKLILIGIYTGLRLGDCCRLDWSQINIAQGVIQLVPRKTRRHHQRMVTIPIHPALGRALLNADASHTQNLAKTDLATTPLPVDFGCQSNDYSVEAEATPESVFAKVASDDSVKNTNLAFFDCGVGRAEIEGEIPGATVVSHIEKRQNCVCAASAFRIGPVLPTIAEMYSRSRWRVCHELTRIFKQANIQTSVRIEGRHRRTPEATFHSLRHTFVSFAANAGVPLHIVQSIVGHESTAMTRHYYHENLDALKSAVAAIPTL